MPVLDGFVLWPSSPAVELDRQLALILISGELPDEDLPGASEDQRSES